MGNLISRPSCLGQKSKHVRSDEDFLKECYQRRREWHPPEHHGEVKRDEAARDKAREDANKDTHVEKEVAQDIGREEAFGRSPLAQPDKGSAERRASFQRRDSREGSPWSWKTLSSREVTEVTEVTETIVTEIVEVTEYPSGEKGGDPIVTRTVRVLNGVAEELAEVDKTTSTFNQTKHFLSVHFILFYHYSETFLQNLEALLTWVCEIEELRANQKPPSSEVKVVKAQLQEQKLLQRLLSDRRRSMDGMMLEGPRLVEAHPGEEGEQARVKLSTLKQKWEALLLEAEQR
uniref:Uncharacterized protein n=1 Tax=Myripristis murdjan TaxID=586833 RepID=A0A668A9W0_9TELE